MPVIWQQCTELVGNHLSSMITIQLLLVILWRFDRSQKKCPSSSDPFKSCQVTIDTLFGVIVNEEILMLNSACHVVLSHDLYENQLNFHRQNIPEFSFHDTVLAMENLISFMTRSLRYDCFSTAQCCLVARQAIVLLGYQLSYGDWLQVARQVTCLLGNWPS